MVAILALVGAATIAPSSLHASSADTFCADLPSIIQNIRSKAFSHETYLATLRSVHNNVFLEKDKELALAETHIPEHAQAVFTEMQGKENNDVSLFALTEKEKDVLEAMRKNLTQVRDLFGEHSKVIDTVLEDVAEAREKAFTKAEEACADGEDSEEVARAFSEDMQDIRSTIREGVEDLSHTRAKLSVLEKDRDEALARAGKAFITNSTHRSFFHRALHRR